MTPQELITRLGGPAKIGRQMGIRPQAVSLWKSKNRVPAERVPTLMRLAKAEGVKVRPEDVRADVDWAALK